MPDQLKQAAQQAEPVAWNAGVPPMYPTQKEGETFSVSYTTTPQQQAEPVSMRMPKVSDKVICLEDESLGTIVSLTAGGSPDIAFDDGSRGTYMLSEFAELFGYVNSPAAQPEQVDCPRCGHVCSQRQWVGLTPDEVKHLYPYGRSIWGKETFEAIEKALKEKNT